MVLIPLNEKSIMFGLSDIKAWPVLFTENVCINLGVHKLIDVLNRKIWVARALITLNS